MAARSHGRGSSGRKASTREEQAELLRQVLNDVYDCTWKVLTEAGADASVADYAADAARIAVREAILRL